MSRSVSGSTRLAAVIGDPVRHSLSPVIHNAGFEALGLDWVYLALPVPKDSAAAAVAGMRAMGIDGLSVTMPHKSEVAEVVDALSPTAQALGAVNCVVRDGHLLLGENTDGAGFLDALRAESGFDPIDKPCVVVGAGGAARAVVQALADAGAESVVVVNRSSEAAERAAALAQDRGRVGTQADITDAALVVQATPMGMAGDLAQVAPFDFARLRRGQLVADLIYQPIMTPLREHCERQGVDHLGGVGMLIHQAGHAFLRWTGCEPPLAAMQAAVEAHLDSPSS